MKDLKNKIKMFCDDCPNKDKFNPTYTVQKTIVNDILLGYYCKEIRNFIKENI
jgi:hypothetical protein